MIILAWHFVGDKLRNGALVPADGVALNFDGPLVLCESGLHASRKIIDALQYAPGNTICRVRCGGEIVESTDKLICRKRTILWRIDGEKVLRKFACQQALSVAGLCNIPPIVREYLETEDESKKAAAYVAAHAAAYGAAYAAAYGAAHAAAYAAAHAAAHAAAYAAARAAAHAAACAAAHAAAYATAYAAAHAAAYGATCGAAHAAAYAATCAAANKMLTKMVMEEHKKHESQN